MSAWRGGSVVTVAVALLLGASTIMGCRGSQESQGLEPPPVASPSPADAAYDRAGMTRACHLAAAGQIYGRNAKQVDDGAGRVYQIPEREADAPAEDADPSLFFDPVAFGHPVTWLNEIVCAASKDRIAVAYDNQMGEPVNDPWLVVLDGAGKVVAERMLPVEADPAQLSFSPSAESLGWVSMDAAPWLWSWSAGDEPFLIEDLTLRAVSGASGGDIVWSEDGRFVAYTAWSGLGVGGAEIALVRADDGQIVWRRALDGDVLAWFDAEHLAWATAPWLQGDAAGATTEPTAIELWRMDVPAAEADAETDAQRLEVLEMADAEAVGRWFRERW